MASPRVRHRHPRPHLVVAPRLTPAKITGAALALIDAHGLPALSMRALGVALGTSAMALYFHYPSKEELLAAVGQALVASVPALAAPTQTRDGALAKAILSQLRAVHAAHRNAYALLHAELSRPEARMSWAALWPRLSPERADLLRIMLVATPSESASPSHLPWHLVEAELLALFFA